MASTSPGSPMPLIRVFFLIALIIALMTAAYVGLSIHLRRERRRELETEYSAGEGGGLNREDYVARGLAEYDRSLPKKLLVGIFAAPILVFIGLVVLANWV